MRGGQVASPWQDYCLPLVQAENSAFTPDAVDYVIVRAADKLVIISTGLPSAMADFIRAQEKDRRGLYFTGEYLGHAHTGGACAQRPHGGHGNHRSLEDMSILYSENRITIIKSVLPFLTLMIV